MNSNFSLSSGRYPDMSIYVMRINLQWGYTDYMIKILSHKYTIRKVKSLALSSSILTHYDFDQKLRTIREKGKNLCLHYHVF